MHSKYDSLLKAVQETTNRDPKFDGVTDTVKAFAKLLVALAEDATEQTTKVIRLTWALLFLTVLLSVVSVIQIILLIFNT